MNRRIDAGRGVRFRGVAVFLLAAVSFGACQARETPPPPVALQSPPASGVPAPSSPATLDPTLVTPRPPEVTLSVQRLPSPDGRWVAESSFEFVEGGAAFRVRLVVRRLDGTAEWDPVDYTQDGIGYIYPALRVWSPDSRSFYYFEMQTPDGCGDFYPEENAWVALDVADGSLSDFPLPAGRGHTVTADGRTMIYATASPPYGLRFRDVQSGTEIFRPFPPAADESREVQAGGWVWSPDGSSVALSAAYGDSCDDRPSLSFSVFRVDRLESPVLTPLVEHSPVLLRLDRWEAADHILVRDWNGESWWMDARSGLAVTAPGTRPQ